MSSHRAQPQTEFFNRIGREQPFAADPPERQVSGAESGEAYDSSGSLAAA